MAYTKTPESDTHGVVRLPSYGEGVNRSQIVASSSVSSSIHYTNCFPEPTKQFASKPEYILRKREAVYILESGIATTGNTSVAFGDSSVLSSNGTYIFFSRNDKSYALDYSVGASTATDLGFTQAAALSGHWINGYDGTNYWGVLLADNVYLVNETGLAVTTVNPTQTLSYTYGIVSMNSYLFASDGNVIYNSNPEDFTTWNTNNFLGAEVYIDKVAFIAKHKNHLVVVGTRGTEFFYDAAVELGSPLARQETYSQAIGGLPNSGQGPGYTQIEDDIYFYGKGADNLVGVYRIQDFKVEKVSTPYIDRILNTITTNVPSKLKRVIFSNRPMIYMQNISPDIDLVFDPLTQIWWELDQTADGGTLAYVSNMVGDMHYAQGWITGNSVDRAVFVYKGSPVYSGATVAIGVTDVSRAYNVTAKYRSELFDNGSNNQRHIKWVDAIGDYGNNTVALTWYKDPTYQTTATLATLSNSAGQLNSYRWRNLGRARRCAFGLTFAGTSDIAHEAIEVAYNIGMW